MAIKSCKECGAHISSSAKSCPHCGISRPGGGMSRGATWLLILIALVIIAMSLSENKQDRQETIRPIEITSTQLYSAYEQNEIAADQLYENKLIKVSGLVSGISKAFDSPVVTLSTGIFSAQVMVTFDGGRNNAFVAGLKHGELITVTGICNGKTLGMVGIRVR